MNSFLYVFLVCIILIGVIVAIAVWVNGSGEEDETHFIDEEGHHKYYERSLIEKNEFHRQNPNVPYSEIRSFRRLFKNLRFRRQGGK